MIKTINVCDRCDKPCEWDSIYAVVGTHTLSFNSGAPSITGTSQPFDVPPGPPTTMDVNLGVPQPPTPPAPQAKKKP